jgi:hypothetical protein
MQVKFRWQRRRIFNHQFECGTRFNQRCDENEKQLRAALRPRLYIKDSMVDYLALAIGYIVVGLGILACVLFCIGMEKLFEFMLAGPEKVASEDKVADNAHRVGVEPERPSN